MNRAKSDNMNQIQKEAAENRPVQEELPFQDRFLEGNEMIEGAIDRYRTDSSDDNLIAVLEAIRQRMHADGHFLFPVLTDEGDRNDFAIRSIRTEEGKDWFAAFTSREEYSKGERSSVLSFFIDSALKAGLNFNGEGYVINPWGKPFFLTKKMIEAIFDADGDEEYTVPDAPVTAELLEDGSYLKRAIGICRKNRTKLNLFNLMKILRDSRVWIPCTAVMSDADNAGMEQMIREAEENGGLESMEGKTFVSHDETRLIPDILESDGEFFFPVFTAAEEMGEYGEKFSKIEKHFLDALNLARNNERNLAGIVINAFSEPFRIPTELYELIEYMESTVEEDEEN